MNKKRIVVSCVLLSMSLMNAAEKKQEQKSPAESQAVAAQRNSTLPSHLIPQNAWEQYMLKVSLQEMHWPFEMEDRMEREEQERAAQRAASSKLTKAGSQTSSSDQK